MSATVRHGTRIVSEHSVPVDDGAATVPLPIDRPGTHRATVAYTETSGVAAGSGAVTLRVRVG